MRRKGMEKLLSGREKSALNFKADTHQNMGKYQIINRLIIFLSCLFP